MRTTLCQVSDNKLLGASGLKMEHHVKVSADESCFVPSERLQAPGSLWLNKNINLCI